MKDELWSREMCLPCGWHPQQAWLSTRHEFSWLAEHRSPKDFCLCVKAPTPLYSDALRFDLLHFLQQVVTLRLPITQFSHLLPPHSLQPFCGHLLGPGAAQVSKRIKSFKESPLGRMSNKEAEHTCTKPKLGFFQRSWWMELLSALGMETMSSIGWEAQSQKSPWPGAGQAARMGGGPGHVALTTPTRCSEMSLGSLSDRWGPGQAFGFYAAVSLFPL